MGMQHKKLLILNILQILQRYTDEEHRLSQAEIGKRLEEVYGMKVERKAIKRNLMDLVESGYPLSYTETVRRNRSGEEELLLTDWYLERDFTDAELRLLIDSLLFSRHIPRGQCKALIQKIEGLSNCYFSQKIRHVCNLPDGLPQNPELFLNVQLLDEAIGKKRQVCFQYHDYGTDKRLHPRLDAQGNVREYRINPYQMVATNGRYYLIGNYDKYKDVSYYRLDRIRRIQVLDTPVKPMTRVRGLENGLELPDHMAEHIYMFSGESGPVSFRVQKSRLCDVFDWFGVGARFSDESEDEVTVHVRVNYQAMKCWAMQYAAGVRVLSPASLVEEIRLALAAAAAKYEQ